MTGEETWWLRTLVAVPEYPHLITIPTLWFATFSISSSRGFSALFWLPYALDKYVCTDIHGNKLPLYIKESMFYM